MARAPSWTCSKCGRTFANKNQWHSCGTFTVEGHLDGAGRDAVEIYRKLESMIRSLGPVDVSPSRTVIAFKNGATFASASFRRGGLRVGVMLDQVVEHPRFIARESVSAYRHAHVFLVERPGDLDGDVAAWLKTAYALASRGRH